ncbi:DUF2931 family protein [Pseudomonas sp. R5(2019)]|uniref:DUF2931 family protein n=1 Tax=Pseudomonas sp. R5(2019) TaxID=2697566 RepID=UPI00141272AF|nr:DUF2931 family protein [Pseudomonas sp. R5(2019)]NBA93979.1 DUF2931 family protein [Pseudomonas sp. R5(2019)]
MRVLFILLSMLLTSGCQALDPLAGTRDPHSPWWNLGFTAPYYLLAHVEHSAVVDTAARLIHLPGGGLIGNEPEGEGTSAHEWAGRGGIGRSVTGAALPQRIYVRWQSIAEPQTYDAWVEVPKEARQIMKTTTSRRCPKYPDSESPYRAIVTLGLAPGGIVQAWTYDECHKPVKIARVKGEVVLLGPYLGKNEGRYAYPVSERSKRYIERFGIPYGSW